MILLDIKNKIATITLNRPEKRNALDDKMAKQLLGHLESLKNNPDCKIVIIKANGEAFCAGADLEYLKKLQNNSYEENLEDSMALMQLFQTLNSFPKITIAQVQGAAFAGGCGLATLCDFVFATPEAKFAYTEVKIGFIPAIVSVFLGPKIGSNKAKEMLLTGAIYSAENTLKLNLINQIFDKELIESQVLQFAENLVESVSYQSVALTKQLLLEIDNKPLKEQLELAAQFNAKARATEDCKQGIAAFLNKEKIKWN